MHRGRLMQDAGFNVIFVLFNICYLFWLFVLFCFVLFCESESLCVVLVVLELIQTRLASNSKILLLLPPEC